MLKADIYIIVLKVKVLSLFLLWRGDEAAKGTEWPGYCTINLIPHL